MTQKTESSEVHEILKDLLSGDPPGGALGAADDAHEKRAIASIVARSFDEDRDTEKKRRIFSSYRSLAGAAGVAAWILLIFLWMLQRDEGDKREVETTPLVSKTADVPIITPLVETKNGDSRVCFRATYQPVSRTLAKDIELLLETESEACAVESDDSLQVNLSRGTVWLSVPPLHDAPLRVSVRTPGGEVRVKGTLFAVRNGGMITDVTVLEGTVETRDTTGTTRMVTAGNRFQMGADAIRPMSASAQVAAWKEVKHRGVAGDRAPILVKPSVLGGELESWGDPPVDENDALEPSETAKKTRENPEQLLARARKQRTDKQWQKTAKTLHSLIALYPQSEEAAVARVTLGRLYVEHLRAPQKALPLFADYLRLAPNHALGEEALYWTARAYRVMGNYRQECETLAQFVTQFTKGPLTETAARRLRRLRGGVGDAWTCDGASPPTK